jgi:hypothetical protein
MALLVLTSTCGSPGVTTLAVGLALAWPRAVLLADCDPGAHQSVLAGFLAGRSAHGKGLLRVAEAHRDGRDLREVVIDQTIQLASDSTHSRLFLPGFAKAGSAGLFAPVWLELAETLDRLGDTGMDVIVDAGRMGAQGLPVPLIEYAGLTCLVLQTNLRSVMSARVHAGTLGEQARLSSADKATGLVLIGEVEPYGKHEISRALGMPVVACVAREPAAAQHLSDGRARTRKFDSGPLAKSIHTSAAALHGHIERAAERIRS